LRRLPGPSPAYGQWPPNLKGSISITLFSSYTLWVEEWGASKCQGGFQVIRLMPDASRESTVAMDDAKERIIINSQTSKIHMNVC
jgi:hypothetical protein